jgi:chromosome segregation ATPase
VDTERKVPEGTLHPERTRSGRLEEWQRLLEALQANRSDLEHLSTQSRELETLLSRAEDLLQSQAALEAGRKEATQRLAELLADCQRLATVLRFALKHHYGPAAEKLTDFGIQPVRGRSKKSAPAVEQVSP